LASGLDIGSVMDAEEAGRDDRNNSDYVTSPGHWSAPNETDLALNSITEPQGWLTDEVITRYFRYLSERNKQWDANMTFISPHFYNRLADTSLEVPVIRPQLLPIFTEELSQDAELEFDALQAMHEDAAIFNYTRIYIPVQRPGHWSLLEIDNSTRTITYIDSLYRGGDEYIGVLETYLHKLEVVRTRTQADSWNRRTTTFGAAQCRSSVQVPRQNNGNDCGVYLCSIADLLEREQDIRQINPTLIPQARQQLYLSMIHSVALPLIAENAGTERSIETRRATTRGTTDTSAHREGQCNSETPTHVDRPSMRPTRSTRNKDVDYTELSPKKGRQLRRIRGINPETCKLAIGPSQQYEGGEELFLDQEVCKQGTIICYYPGKCITVEEVHASSSKYIMRTQIGPDEWVYLDAADKNCGYGRYADDSLYNGTENAEWRAVGRGKDRRMALVATCTIKKGMPIRAPYGWEYWHQPDALPLELMRKAFKGYFDRIASSPKHSLAWEFARSVGGEAALLTAWEGRRLHEEVPVEEQVSTSADELSSDGATDEDFYGEDFKVAQVEDNHNRKRGRTEGINDHLAAATEILVSQQPTEEQRRCKKITKRGSTRGRSLPMQLKARVGRPASRTVNHNSDADSDTGVHIRPPALPVYRAGTNYNTWRQIITQQRILMELRPEGASEGEPTVGTSSVSHQQATKKCQRTTMVKRGSKQRSQHRSNSFLSPKTRVGRHGPRSLVSPLHPDVVQPTTTSIGLTSTPTTAPSNTPTGSPPSVPTGPPWTTETDSTTSVLLVGMVYTKDNLMRSKLQLTRDGIRCRALERTEHTTVHTIDVTHNVDQAVEGRHICHDFAKHGVLTSMDGQWSGKVFKHVIMDYFYTPDSWHAERWNEAMYTTTLPIMASKGAIPLDGEVWLPHIACIENRLKRLKELLQPWFTVNMVANPMENPLYRATQTVATELVEDGNPFTNATALRSLPTDSPFIVLRCINSGNKLDVNQRAGCGSLLDPAVEPTRSLRPRLHQVVHQPTRTAGLKRYTQTHDLTVTGLVTRDTHSTTAIQSEYRLHFPIETAGRLDVDGALATVPTPQLLYDKETGAAITVDSSDIHRVMKGMLNDKAVDEYLRLLCTTHMQYKAEHILPNFAPYIYSQVPKPPGDVILTRTDLFHRLRNHDLFTCEVLISPTLQEVT
jgi:hypothetical protein